MLSSSETRKTKSYGTYGDADAMIFSARVEDTALSLEIATRKVVTELRFELWVGDAALVPVVEVA